MSDNFVEVPEALKQSTAQKCFAAALEALSLRGVEFSEESDTRLYMRAALRAFHAAESVLRDAIAGFQREHPGKHHCGFSTDLPLIVASALFANECGADADSPCYSIAGRKIYGFALAAMAMDRMTELDGLICDAELMIGGDKAEPVLREMYNHDLEMELFNRMRRGQAPEE